MRSSSLSLGMKGNRMLPSTVARAVPSPYLHQDQRSEKSGSQLERLWGGISGREVGVDLIKKPTCISLYTQYIMGFRGRLEHGEQRQGIHVVEGTSRLAERL